MSDVIAVDRLFELGRWLQQRSYTFTTVTPATHQIVLSRRRQGPPSLRDIFGWNVPFNNDALISNPGQAAPGLPADLVDRLFSGHVVTMSEDNTYRSRVRAATLDDSIYIHSGFPTTAADSVFFGPDTYRFARLLQRFGHLLAGQTIETLVDVGAGSGAGGLSLARHAHRVVLGDINSTALDFCRANATLLSPASTEVVIVQSDVLQSIPGRIDAVIANPPYLVDAEQRIYRHGGGHRGLTLAERIVDEALERLMSGGWLVIYTGVPIVNGEDLFWRNIGARVTARARRIEYSEIDPDVFGEELNRDVYADVDRLAVVGLIAQLK